MSNKGKYTTYEPKASDDETIGIASTTKLKRLYGAPLKFDRDEMFSVLNDELTNVREAGAQLRDRKILSSSRDVITTISDTKNDQRAPSLVSRINPNTTLSIRSIAVTPATASISVGSTQAFTAVATLTDLTSQDVTVSSVWTSSNASVVSMSANVGTGVSVGSATITATKSGVSGSTPVTVPFVPSAIAGLTMWLRSDLGLYQTSDTSTPVTANGQSVGHWHDQSGNGYHATQTDGSKMPVYNASIAGANNKPAIFFDSVGTHTLRADSASDYIGTQYSIFAVWSVTNALGVHIVICSTNHNFWMGCDANNIMTVHGAGSVGFGSVANNEWLIQETFGFGNYPWYAYAYKNGIRFNITNLAMYDYPGKIALNNYYGSQNMGGYIAELIVYSSELNATNRKLVEAYLGSRYNISVPP